MNISFVREKETKNTIRFAEIAKQGEEIVGSLYVRKAALKALGDPDRLVVTIEAPR